MRVSFMAAVCAAAFLATSPARATFSIIACDEQKSCGAAVATNNLAVGATVIYAQAGVGVVASQFETNPSHGPNGLMLLRAGRTAQAALAELVRTDDGFEGQTVEHRQIGIVGTAGPGAAFTGDVAGASSWAGTLTGERFSIQGNGLAGAQVLDAMRTAYLTTRGPLEDRLMAALEAGEAAGGQSTGRLSAALLVRTQEGGFQDIDLRVDAADLPTRDLRRLLNMHNAHQMIIRAERAAGAGRRGEAQARVADAIRLGSGWDRIWRRAARLQMSMNNKEAALQALAALAQVNQAWAAREVEDPLYTALWSDADAQQWKRHVSAR